LGDVHCEHAALRQALQRFAERRVDAVLSVGDLVDGVGDVELTLALMEDAGVLAVAGNHDAALLAGAARHVRDATPAGSLSARSERYLRSLPLLREFETPRGWLLLCHGLGEDTLAGITPALPPAQALALPALAKLLQAQRYALVVNGHTHEPMLRRLGSLSLLNAGTLHSRYRPVCSVLDFDAGALDFWDVSAAATQHAARWPLDAECEFLSTP
jgi:predicted phosphodiesterase